MSEEQVRAAIQKALVESKEYAPITLGVIETYMASHVVATVMQCIDAHTYEKTGKIAWGANLSKERSSVGFIRWHASNGTTEKIESGGILCGLDLKRAGFRTSMGDFCSGEPPTASESLWQIGHEGFRRRVLNLLVTEVLAKFQSAYGSLFVMSTSTEIQIIYVVVNFDEIRAQEVAAFEEALEVRLCAATAAARKPHAKPAKNNAANH